MVNVRLTGKTTVRIFVLRFPRSAEVTDGNKLVQINITRLLTKDGDEMITWESIIVGGVRAAYRRPLSLRSESHMLKSHCIQLNHYGSFNKIVSLSKGKGLLIGARL